jgi:hypothetical protein
VHDTRVLGRADELYVRSIVVGLERLETLLGDALDLFLLLSLRVAVGALDGLAEPADTVLGGPGRCEELPSVHTDHVQLLDMLLLRTTFTLSTLLTLQRLGRPGVLERCLARPANFGTNQGEKYTMGQAFQDESPHLSLLVDEAEPLGLDECAQLAPSTSLRCDEYGESLIVLAALLPEAVEATVVHCRMHALELHSAMLDASVDELVSIREDGCRRCKDRCSPRCRRHRSDRVGVELEVTLLLKVTLLLDDPGLGRAL